MGGFGGMLIGHSIHNLGLVGHIEDIVVDKDQQGKKLGLRIIEALDYIAAKVGCYKVRVTSRKAAHSIYASQFPNLVGLRG